MALWRVTWELYFRTVERMENPGWVVSTPLKQVGSRPPTSTRTPLLLLVWRKYSSASSSFEKHCLEYTFVWTSAHITRCVTDIQTRAFERKRPALWRFIEEFMVIPPHDKDAKADLFIQQMKQSILTRATFHHCHYWGSRKAWRKEWEDMERSREKPLPWGTESGQVGGEQ